MHGDSRTSRASSGSSGRSSKGSTKTWKTLVTILMFFFMVTAGLNIWKYGFSQAVANSKVGDTGTTTSPQGNNQLGESTSEQLLALTQIASETEGPWISANQTDFTYAVSGKVHNQTTKALIDRSVEDTYGEAGTSSIEVDPNISESKWPDDFPDLLREGAALFIDGGFAINDEKLYLKGTFPNAEDEELLFQRAAELRFPRAQKESTIVDLKSPSVKATVADQKVTLEGSLPTQDLIDTIQIESTQVYGAGNITNNLKVDEKTFARFSLRRWGDNLRKFQPFGDYTLEIVNEQIGCEVSGGVVFDSGSFTLSSRGETLLEVFPELLSRSNGSIEVIGHTDNNGDAATNLQLSSDRADAVEAFFVANEVDPTRIETLAKGETDPIAPNDTDQGQRRNRRVEIVIIPRE